MRRTIIGGVVRCNRYRRGCLANDVCDGSGANIAIVTCSRKAPAIGHVGVCISVCCVQSYRTYSSVCFSIRTRDRGNGRSMRQTIIGGVVWRHHYGRGSFGNREGPWYKIKGVIREAYT